MCKYARVKMSVCRYDLFMYTYHSLQLQVSFAKEPYKRDDILQKRPIMWRSLLLMICIYTILSNRASASVAIEGRSLLQDIVSFIGLFWLEHICTFTHGAFGGDWRHVFFVCGSANVCQWTCCCMHIIMSPPGEEPLMDWEKALKWWPSTETHEQFNQRIQCVFCVCIRRCARI